MVTPSQRPPARYAWAFTHGDLIAGRVSAQQSSGRHSHCRGRGHVLMASARRHQRPGRSGAVRGAPHVRAYAPQVSLPTPPGSDALDCERPADYLAPQGRVGVRAGSLLPAWPQLGNHRTLEGVVAAHSESVEVSHNRSACGAERGRQRNARDGVGGCSLKSSGAPHGSLNFVPAAPDVRGISGRRSGIGSSPCVQPHFALCRRLLVDDRLGRCAVRHRR
jgi:hypothetical protein